MPHSTTVGALVRAVATAPPRDRAVALIAADALTEALGDRPAALRIVAALRRIGRRHDMVSMAARLVSDASPVRRFILQALTMYALGQGADVVTLAIIPGRRPPAEIAYGTLGEYPHARVIAPIYLGDVVEALQGAGPRHSVILVGARYVVTLAAPMLPRVFRGVPEELYL